MRGSAAPPFGVAGAVACSAGRERVQQTAPAASAEQARDFAKANENGNEDRQNRIDCRSLVR